MKLYFSRNYNPRLAVAVARYLNSPVEFEFASPFSPGERDKFIKLNPNLSLPILVDGDATLWEADAIACRLARLAGSPLWPTDDAQPDLIRWLSWGHCHFVRGCDHVHFERVTKQRYGLGPIRPEIVEAGLNEFASSAAILQQHLAQRDWLVGDAVTYADFRVACVLPFADLAGLPLGDFPRVQAWHARLMEIPAWRDPFAGLDAPELPPIGAAAQ
ncbi:glutathione S-transferase family protein [Paraburkholderia sp. MMS20-SJTR3]|uniref:Glutathione S-transferase family protein n=1 Tax=Paraburkholderia sejongensis TaxID=2886946 RepID=A0ABS8JS56_9BURK|nr:glutathione S-transferase family protein [Paraburkholderia sp. MMS20-SJTR3]MCC8392738.1 glutathione S-transferase family protein [Paraburkholderia sp. MMS20-SJTR3]